MISNPTHKGKTSEAIILAALARLGKSILIPWGEERYDLALDKGGRLVRRRRPHGADGAGAHLRHVGLKVTP